MSSNSVLEALQLQLRNNIFLDNYKPKLSSLIINAILIYYTRHYSMSKRMMTLTIFSYRVRVDILTLLG